MLSHKIPLVVGKFLKERVYENWWALNNHMLNLIHTGTNVGLREIFVRWIAPTVKWVALNTDGAAKGTSGLAGGVGILRDNCGKFP